jgi:membrane-bound metal-dependent hydrolase YbcI (DUF457 family)
VQVTLPKGIYCQSRHQYWALAMPWSAHLSQQVIIAEYASSHFSSSSVLPFSWLLLGALFPDYFLVAKAWMYFRNPRNARSGLLGAGHSILVCTAVSALISVVDLQGSLAFLVGATSHILSDMTDSKGCAALYPVTDRRISLGLWTHTGDKGLVGDVKAFCGNWKAIAFESFFGLWALIILLSWFGLI